MNPLPTELRNKLERTIIEARDVAEAGAKAALEALAVHHHEPYGHIIWMLLFSLPVIHWDGFINSGRVNVKKK